MDTDIYKALLRPSMILGVPSQFMILETTLLLMMIIYNTLSLIFYIPILHALVWLLSLHDPYLIDLILRSKIATLPTRNKRFWRAQSYAP